MRDAEGLQLRIYADTSAIVPFWSRVPEFFRYPLHWASIGLILVTFVLAFATQGTVIGGLLMTLLSVAAVRYGYIVLDRTAQGHLDAKELFDESAANDAPYRPYKQWLVFVLWGLITTLVAHWLGWAFAAVVSLALLIALPASIMSLGINDSLLEAIDPRALLFIITQIGWAYALLCVFLMMLLSSPGAALVLVAGWIPANLLYPLICGLQSYFLIVMFNLMGYVLFQYHDRLGLAVHRPEFNEKPDDKALFAKALEENRIEDALGLAYEMQRLNPEDVEAQERHYKILLLAKKNDKALYSAQKLLPLLLRKGRDARALEVYAECRGLQAEFRLTKSADQLMLAHAALAQRENTVAMHALLRFEKLYPESPEAPAAWLLQAKIMAERLHKDEAAMQLLRLLRGKFPKSPEAVEAKQYLAALTNFARIRAGHPNP
jgi:hypothetical protein